MIFDGLQTKQEREILSVGELNKRAKRLLESQFPLLWVEGEISNFAQPSSGHWYFTLKDQQAQVRCAMFRNRNQRLQFRPNAGDQVLARARVSLYEGRGEFQLIIDHLEEVGDGALQRAVEELKNKLSEEGLFRAQHKQELPTLPRHIGVITSPSGAAVHDIITILKRRFPAILVSILPVSVQGEKAPEDLCQAIHFANQQAEKLQPPLDVLIVGRGGGSLEDLQAFNDEGVARAIFNSKLPIVSAVGHEIDFSIADFVADARAATPSAAAELLSPDQEHWLGTLQGIEILLSDRMKALLNAKQQQVNWLHKRLRHPGSRLLEQAQRLDDLEMHLKNAIQRHLLMAQHRLKELLNRLNTQSPEQSFETTSIQINNLKQRLFMQMSCKLQEKKMHLLNATQLLETVSPLATLNRGYAIITDSQRNILRESSSVKVGEQVTARLSTGQLHCTVDKTE